ncbi:MAG: helix-turn-helix domain-containing protein [Oscillospiraceae bacterium]|nr:helix-turn-helix domain-containing protein [Oscillospiraceae bacterium]
MNQYVTGEAIRTLREKNRYTQAELAAKINVSDKAVSKWETGKGYPDITLLEPLAAALKVSVTELISGNSVSNTNVSANMFRSKFYVCPVCGNVIHSMGEAVIHCHGVTLTPAEEEMPDEHHQATVDIVEDEYFVTVSHEMSKQHYISFMAAVSPDRVQIVKLYPEGNAEARFKLNGVRKICWYCNRDGLFCIDPRKK